MNSREDNALPRMIKCIAPHLSSQTKRLMQSLSHDVLLEITTIQPSPYRTKIEFLIGTTGIWKDKSHFDFAWNLYKKTTQYEIVLLSVGQEQKDDLAFLQKIAKQNNNKPIMINVSGQIKLYAFSESEWKLTDLKNNVFSDLKFPEENIQILLRSSDLTEAMYHEIKSKMSHRCSSSIYPAMLYKINDLDFLIGSDAIATFSKNEDMQLTARQYCPGKEHCWDINQAWIMAQIHARRSLVVFSNLTEDHLWRRGKRTEYSAFAREIAVAIKANYTISINDSNRLQLNPPKEKAEAGDVQSPTFTNLKADENNIREIYEHVNLQKTVKFLIKNLNDLYEEINQINFFELFLFPTTKRIDDVFSKAFKDCHHPDLALLHFINAYNERQFPNATLLLRSKLPTLFNEQGVIHLDRLKKRVMKSFKTRIGVLMEMDENPINTTCKSNSVCI